MRESAVVAKYGLSDREEYLKYHKVISQVKRCARLYLFVFFSSDCVCRLTTHLATFDTEDPYRKMMTQALLRVRPSAQLKIALNC